MHQCCKPADRTYSYRARPAVNTNPPDWNAIWNNVVFFCFRSLSPHTKHTVLFTALTNLPVIAAASRIVCELVGFAAYLFVQFAVKANGTWRGEGGMADNRGLVQPQ